MVCLMGVSIALHEEVPFDEGAVTAGDWMSYPILQDGRGARDQGRARTSSGDRLCGPRSGVGNLECSGPFCNRVSRLRRHWQACAAPASLARYRHTRAIRVTDSTLGDGASATPSSNVRVASFSASKVRKTMLVAAAQTIARCRLANARKGIQQAGARTQRVHATLATAIPKVCLDTERGRQGEGDCGTYGRGLRRANRDVWSLFYGVWFLCAHGPGAKREHDDWR